MKVWIAVKNPLYRDYFLSLFPADSEGRRTITRDTDLGKAIYASVRYSQQRITEEIPEGSICIHLSKSSDYPTAPNRFLYFTREDLVRINDLLEVFFNIDLDRYYLRGLKLGMQQKEVIQSFIVERGLTNLLHDVETLKKRQYREELSLLDRQTRILLEKARNRNLRIGITPAQIRQNNS